MTDTESKQNRQRGSSSTIDPSSEIARRLKSYYSAVENEPVPDAFLNLLEKLDEAERKAKNPP